MKNNYDKLMQAQIKSVVDSGKKPKLLLHACCAPCSTACLERVIEFFDVTVYFYNPNITSQIEYDKRLLEIKNFLQNAYNGNVNLIYEDYNANEFLNAVKGYETEPEGGKRCKICYALRLDKTANYAKNNGFDYFTTTLSVSPHKNAEWLNELGVLISKKYNVNYLYADFKKQGGYLRSIQLSKEYNLYRQDYCGCDYSINKKNP